MDSREKRIYLRLCSKSERQRAVIEKLEHYDKRRYDSLTEYIVQAILAFNEPVSIGEDRLRQILREELGGNRKSIQESAAQEREHQEEEQSGAYPGETNREIAEPQKVPDNEAQPEALTEPAPDMDDTAIQFMKELGIM